MGNKIADYRAKLRTLKDWDSFLLAESGLPGPRANLELIQAVADEGDEALFKRYLSLDPASSPTNSPQVFLVVCGVVGLGRLVAEGRRVWLKTLRQCASDSRWRVREGVAMALQRFGDADMQALLHEMEDWSRGSWLEMRAAVAALCEPRLLSRPDDARRVLDLLDQITDALGGATDRRSDDFKTLRQALGYCWSVAVAALPESGQPMMEHWFLSENADVTWVMKGNLKKARLARMDAAWVEKGKKRLGMS